MKHKSVLNYFLSTSLDRLRLEPPYFTYPKNDYFKTYEPKMKEELNGPDTIFAILFEDKTTQVSYTLDEIDNEKKIISWLAFKKPNFLIYAYTRQAHRRKGYASTLFNLLKDHFLLSNVIFMEFYSPQGFRFMEALGKKHGFKTYTKVK